MDDDVSVKDKREILTQELQLWKNTAYQFSVRYKVSKKIGATEQALKSIEVEMGKCEMVIDALNEELKGLD